MNNKELLIIICPIVYMILMILETYLYNKRVKRYLKINENIIKFYKIKLLNVNIISDFIIVSNIQWHI